MIQLGTATVSLLPDRAAYWPAQKALLLADVHLGKDQVFRRSGMAVPAGVMAADLQRIDALLELTGAERLIVLGDWVHAPPRADDAWPTQITQWRQEHAQLSIDLVLGNHDRALAPWLAAWDMRPHQPWLDLDGLKLVHDWTDAPGQPGISGHLHPGAVIKNRRQRLRLPAFLLGDDHLVMPAFGRFTGLMTETDFPARRRIAIAGEQLIELPD
ncbi:MAG: ligase-associated DNA damage response endonuclease PdeM [Wenzhouxiangella sp.]